MYTMVPLGCFITVIRWPQPMGCNSPQNLAVYTSAYSLLGITRKGGKLVGRTNEMVLMALLFGHRAFT